MKKAFFCIDGFSFKRISDFYRNEHTRHSRLSISAMETYLRFELERRFEWQSDPENLAVEKHFYHPGTKPVRGSLLNFERNLADSGYTVHYQEEGVPVPRLNRGIFYDWIISKNFRKFDIFALLTTQGQYANIFRQNRERKIPSILIGWDSICKNSFGASSWWKTDKTLIECASVYCPLERTLNLPNNDEHPLAGIMFENLFSPRYPLDQRFG